MRTLTNAYSNRMVAPTLAGLVVVLLSATDASPALACEAVVAPEMGIAFIESKAAVSCDDPPPRSGDSERRTSFRVGATDADGSPCLGWGSRAVADDVEERLVQREQNDQLERWYRENDLTDLGIEDRGGGIPGLIDGRFDLIRTPQDVDDCVFPPGFIAALYATVRHELPWPEPYVAPGWAITGLPAYLEVGAPVEFDQTLTALGVGVRVWGQADYRVDWGDGRVVTYPRDSGGPYPEGNIRHTYGQVADPQTITVTGVWTLSWSAPGQTVSGIVLEIPASYELPVRQLQAVRTTLR